jgi:nitric oxide reductase large subunit
VAGALALSGKSNVQRGVPPVPEQTVETVREDVEMTKQRVQEGRR